MIAQVQKDAMNKGHDNDLHHDIRFEEKPPYREIQRRGTSKADCFNGFLFHNLPLLLL